MKKQNLYQLHVKDMMSKEVVTVSPQDSLHDSLQLMAENRVSALPVIDHHGRCLGMLSSSDFIDITRELDDEIHELDRADTATQRWLMEKIRAGVGHENVAEHMTEHVATISADALLSEAARLMLRNRVHRLPVIDDDQRLVGIISTMDILRAFTNTAS